MVAVLLNTLRPDAIRTDGSGGDGGQDVHFATPPGPEIFELKSFTGRVTPNRWKQIDRSLKRATGLNPVSWTVVCPIDLTNKERDKFEALTRDSSFECGWLGKTWLDARMAEHPAIGRYLASDVTAEIADLARLLQQEQAALSNGVRDAVDRVRALADLCDRLDPYYRIDLATDTASNSVTARLTPRYAGAERDRPITLEAALSFPDQKSAEAVEMALDFGEGVEIPPEYVRQLVVDAPGGLAGEYGSALLRIEPNALQGVPVLQLSASLTSPGGRTLATIQLTGKATNVGRGGIVAKLFDSSGLLAVELRFDWKRNKYTLNYHYDAKPALPNALLPPLRFLANLNGPNRMTLKLADGKAIGPPELLPTGERNKVLAQSIETIQALARVQDATSTWFDTPSQLSEEDLRDLAVTGELLAGKIVRGTWQLRSGDMTFQHAKELLDQVLSTAGSYDAALSLWTKSDLSLSIAGNEIPLGASTIVSHSAKLREPAATIALIDTAVPTDTIRIEFVPGSVDTFETWLGSPEERPKTG
jgi:hypothetical protein